MLSKMIQLKDVKPGMLIKSREGDHISYKKVIDVWNTQVKISDRLILEFTNGVRLRCSCNHPIMVLTENGIEQRLPRELNEFDEVITDQGSCYLYSLENDIEEIDYIDIEVEDTHTFFASQSKSSPMILTHNSQGGVRGGAATLYYPLWHLEVEDLLVLKNNKGTEDNRIRHLDYGVQFNRVMYERLLIGGNITLFSPHDVPDMYEAFFTDTDRFKELYERYERSTKIRKKSIPAIELFSSFIQERKDTGRIYLMNVDHVNDHGAFIKEKAPIRMSNLCLTGDSKLEILHSDGKREHISLSSFVELFAYGSMTGVKVRSYDTLSSEYMWADVTAAALTATATELIEIEDENGNVIRCTPDHLIWTKNRGWIAAKDLDENDVLCAEI
jgi:intein/homing endonuclease